MRIFGVSLALVPQLIAEIGDVRHYHSKKALEAFADIDTHLTSPARWIFTAAVSPNVVRLHCAERFSC